MSTHDAVLFPNDPKIRAGIENYLQNLNLHRNLEEL